MQFDLHDELEVQGRWKCRESRNAIEVGTYINEAAMVNPPACEKEVIRSYKMKGVREVRN